MGARLSPPAVMQVLATVFLGFSQGASPIIGFNYGAGQSDRVKQTVRLLVTVALSMSITFWLLLELFPGVFVLLFNDDPELVEYGTWGFADLRRGHLRHGHAARLSAVLRGPGPGQDLPVPGPAAASSSCSSR